MEWIVINNKTTTVYVRGSDISCVEEHFNPAIDNKIDYVRFILDSGEKVIWNPSSDEERERMMKFVTDFRESTTR